MKERRTRYIPPSERDQATGEAEQIQPGFVVDISEELPPEPPMEEPRKKKGHGKLIAVLLILLVILAAAGFVAYKRAPYLLDQYGIRQEDRPYTLIVRLGDIGENSENMSFVPETLQREQIILDAAGFRQYVMKKDPDFKYAPGEYQLNANMSFDELIFALQHPDVAYRYVDKVTIPEGYSIWKIAQLMADNGVCGYGEFLEAANNYDYDYEFVRHLEQTDSDLICYKLEGFLFPATYTNLRVGMDAHDVVDLMLQAFENHLPEDALMVCSEHGVSLRKMMTLASVIQAESYGAEMMKGVSSVFWNRLEDPSFTPKLLQSDPTTTYANAIMDEVMDASEEMIAAYDTYRSEGIPPGSINNPGDEAIDAALHPADTEYLYFVTDTEHNIYYAVTLAEHYANCRAVGLM